MPSLRKIVWKFLVFKYFPKSVKVSPHKICTQMFIKALFLTEQNSKQPSCPSGDTSINHFTCMQQRIYPSNAKQNEARSQFLIRHEGTETQIAENSRLKMRHTVWAQLVELLEKAEAQLVGRPVISRGAREVRAIQREVAVDL